MRTGVRKYHNRTAESLNVFPRMIDAEPSLYPYTKKQEHSMSHLDSATCDGCLARDSHPFRDAKLRRPEKFGHSDPRARERQVYAISILRHAEPENEQVRRNRKVTLQLLCFGLKAA